MNRLPTFTCLNFKKHLALVSLMAWLSCLALADLDKATLKIHGEGWLQMGRIMALSDTIDLEYNYSDNWLQSMGTYFTVNADIGDHWDGALGLGGAQYYSAQGIIRDVRDAKGIWELFITKANMAYYSGEKYYSPLSVKFGYLSFIYNKDISTFGEYLNRGPVYPGFLFGEFESDDLDTNLANTLGIQVASRLGLVEQNLVIKSETEFPPIFDLSLIYTLGFHLGEFFTLEGGVNLYRLVPLKPNIETEGNIFILDTSQTSHPYELIHGYSGTKIDANGNSYTDTTYFTGRGTKLMGRMSLDLAGLLGRTDWGEFKIYSEVAVLGIKNQYPVYTKLSERIPVMAGLKIPTFGFLDELVVECEWYGAKFKNDYFNLSNQFSPVPVSNGDYNRYSTPSGMFAGDTTLSFSDPIDVQNMSKDNLKWSVYLTKNISSGVLLSFQVANDHFRPNAHDPASKSYRTAFTDVSDFYAMFRLGYFF